MRRIFKETLFVGRKFLRVHTRYRSRIDRNTYVKSKDSDIPRKKCLIKKDARQDGAQCSNIMLLSQIRSNSRKYKELR